MGSSQCVPGTTSCGSRDIVATENTEANCQTDKSASETCPCPVPVADRNGGKCGVLTFNVPSGGTQGEYEVHNNDLVILLTTL
jgi:hypothetical protein